MKRFVKRFVATVKEMEGRPMKECAIGKGCSVIICRAGNAFYATDTLCTHEAFSLIDGELVGGVITCPLHGAKFDVRTGTVKALPATKPLRTYPVEVVGGKIFVLLNGGGRKHE